MDVNYYIILLKSGLKFFNISDLQLIWGINERTRINNIIRYYKTNQKIFSIRSGLYSIVPINEISFEDKLIIANKIITPSYISYHTALSINGVNFQYYDSIHLIADYHKKITILGTNIVYHKIGNSAFLAKLGLIEIKNPNGSYIIANTERSIIDSWYINPNIGIDIINPKKIDKKLLIKIANIYNKPLIFKNLKKYNLC